jgi:hypothetical protein
MRKRSRRKATARRLALLRSSELASEILARPAGGKEKEFQRLGRYPKPTTDVIWMPQGPTLSADAISMRKLSDAFGILQRLCDDDLDDCSSALSHLDTIDSEIQIGRALQRKPRFNLP